MSQIYDVIGICSMIIILFANDGVCPIDKTNYIATIYTMIVHLIIN